MIEFINSLKKYLNTKNITGGNNNLQTDNLLSGEDNNDVIKNYLTKINQYKLFIQMLKSYSVKNDVVKNSIKQYPLATRFPFLVPKKIHSFFVTIHSKSYNKLKSRDVLYNLYLLKKV
jgi:hypothetical protein